MNCKNCKHWQGTKYSEWGDCYCIIRHIEPNLEACYLSNEYGTVIRYFSVPFDPHDYKYWSLNHYWKKLYGNIKSNKLGVKMIELSKNDILFDYKGGERVGKVPLKFFQTYRRFHCEDFQHKVV